MYTHTHTNIFNISCRYVDFDDDLDNWPRSQVNFFLNVCPQGEMMVVERLGKLNDIKEGGWFIAIPGIDSIRYDIYIYVYFEYKFISFR